MEVKEIYNDGSEPKEVEINTLHAKPQDKTYRLSQSKHEIFGSNLSASLSPEFFQMIPLRLGSANYYQGVSLQLSNKGDGICYQSGSPSFVQGYRHDYYAHDCPMARPAPHHNKSNISTADTNRRNSRGINYTQAFFNLTIILTKQLNHVRYAIATVLLAFY